MAVPQKIQKILIIRFSSIGDIILTTPVIRAVRWAFPNAEIDFLTKKNFTDLLLHNPHLRRVIGFDTAEGFEGLKQLRRILQQNGYDWVIDLHQNLRSRYLRHVFYHTSYPKYRLRRWLMTRFKIRLADISPVYLRYFEALKPQQISYDGAGTEVIFSPADLEKVQNLLRPQAFHLFPKLLAICIGASAATKRWLPERFALVADYFAQKGYGIVFIGGKEDAEPTEAVRKMMATQSKSLNLAGQCSLLESAAVLFLSKIVLTHDTGMMHLAQAQKRPVVAIFGATTRDFGFFPLPDQSLVVEKKLPCRPCSLHGSATCPKGHFDCMRTIEAQEVIKGIEELESRF